MCKCQKIKSNKDDGSEGKSCYGKCCRWCCWLWCAAVVIVVGMLMFLCVQKCRLSGGCSDSGCAVPDSTEVVDSLSK